MSLPERIELRARWTARQETVDDCAAKLHSFLLKLSKCDELFARNWLKCARARFSRRTGGLETVRGLEPLTMSIDELQNLLCEGRLRRDDNNAVIEDMGFRSGGLWNGSEEEPIHVSVSCGAYHVNLYSLPAPNDVSVAFPYEGPGTARILQPAKLREIVRIVVEHWEPDWAHISTGDLFLAVYPEPAGQTVGWFTYISDHYGKLPPLTPECEVTRVDNFGNVIFINSIDRPTASNEAHVRAIRNVSEILRKAGMLAPIPPKANEDRSR